MTPPHPSARRRLVALGVTALPIVFGGLRALQTGSDFRYLISAGASLAAAVGCFRFGSPRVSSRWMVVGVALCAATLASAAAAFAQGARSAGAVWFVSLGFGLCVVSGGVLGLFDVNLAEGTSAEGRSGEP